MGIRAPIIYPTISSIAGTAVSPSSSSATMAAAGDGGSLCSLVADTIWAEIESAKSVTDEQLSKLHFLFGGNLERAIRIVDMRGVKRVTASPSGRSVFQVMGESKRKEEYVCLGNHYCNCYAFFYETVNRGEQLSCKHLLAARFASAVGECTEVTLSDEDLALLLANI